MFPEISEIKGMRMKKGWTQHALAKEANVSQSLIAKIESGRIDPRYSSMVAIVDALEKLSKGGITAKTIVNKPLVSVNKGNSVRDAISRMEKGSYSQLPVLEGGRSVGSVTDGGIIREFLSTTPQKLADMRVKDIMEPPFPQVNEDCPIEQIKSLLEHYSAILVLKDGVIDGILTKSDILKTVI